MGTFAADVLKGKTAFIAGGSSGINLGIAHGLAEAGASIALISRKIEKVEAAVAELKVAGYEASGYAVDVRDFAGVEQALRDVHAARGPIDIVVSGAAGNFLAPAIGMSANAFKTVIDIDLMGTFHVLRASYEFLRKPGASVISISAGQAVNPTLFQSHVCAAKAGINMLTRCLAMEWGAAGVRVNAISPGPIRDTEGMARLTPTPESEAALKRVIPLGDYGEKRDIADLAVYLCSDSARYITGAILDCDGGFSLAGGGAVIGACEHTAADLASHRLQEQPMPGVRIETADRVMIVTLDRASKKNALTDEMYGEIAGALDQAATDDSVRVAMLAGDGPDFCAGNDISMFTDAAAGGPDIETSNVGPFLTALSTFPKPLVAAVTGRAIGVGATMLLHCDLVFVASDAQLILPFVNLGLTPEAGSAWLLPQRIGHVRAFALMALGERLSGDAAASLGLANVALPAAEVGPAAMAAARTLADKSPSALAATKRLMRDAGAIETAIAADREALLTQLATPEAAAAFAAFATRKSVTA